MEKVETKETKKRRTGKTQWHREATNVLKSLMARDGVSPKALSTRFDEVLGLTEEVRPLRNKIARGTFSFIFFLQALHALGYKDIAFKLTPPPPKPKKSKDKEPATPPKSNPATGRR